MPKYTTKETLLHAIREARAGLEKKFSTLSPEQMIWPGSMDHWSVKDILAHLVDWEQRLISWYQAGLRGEVPEIPAPGMSWRDLPALNQQGYERHRDETLDEVMENFIGSYQETLRLIEGMNEEEIYTPGSGRGIRSERPRLKKLGSLRVISTTYPESSWLAFKDVRIKDANIY
ncbi:MAG: hypothetical protein AMJ88_19240 [Anaerolineae bacterium SM23_ 63]|nr:MAG: hypothetical protein AMJ88_19240 [Anaerolineae bacterium SM23_ 63]